MDTKSRNIKSNPLLKILSVVISILLCCVFTLNALPVAQGLYTFEDNLLNKEKTVYDTRYFQNAFNEDMDNILSCAVANTVKKSYAKSQEQFVETALSRFSESQEFYKAHSDEIKECFLNDSVITLINGTNIIEYTASDLTNTYSLYYEFDAEGIARIYFADDIPVQLADDGNEFFSVELDINSSESIAKHKLTEIYDNQYSFQGIGNSYSLIHDNYDTPPENLTLSYYIKADDGTVVTNVKNADELKKTKSADNFIVIKDGDIYSSNNIGTAFYDHSDNKIYYIKEGYALASIKPENNDSYSKALAKYNKSMEELNNSVEKKILICAVCLIALIIMLIIHATLAGYSARGIKTNLIDKVPNDIHLAINIAVGVGAAMLTGVMLEEYLTLDASYGYNNGITNDFYNSSLFKPSLMACISVGWLAVVELVTSYARQFKADKIKFLKNSIIYLLLAFVFKIAKWVIKNVFVKPTGKIKSALKYKPESFKKQIIIYILGYAAINIVLLMLIAFWLMGSIEIMAFLTAFLLVALNGVAVGFVAWYIIQLDKIIVSIKNNTIANVDYSRLPNSLKLLYDYQKNAHEQLSKAVDDAVKNERMRVELITNVSHDLKTPLTSIINYVDLLKQCDIQDESAKEYIGVLDDKGKKLKRLIEDLIEASKVTSGVISLNPVELDLSELATQAVVEHQQEFIDNGLELIFKGDRQSHMAYADGQKTFRVIENLLSNARKYSARGSRVYADVYEQNGISVFEIKNVSAQALDITADELKKRFVRGDKSRNQDGNGLGLSIADNLCSAMNGRMEITIDGDLFKVKVFLPKKL